MKVKVHCSSCGRRFYIEYDMREEPSKICEKCKKDDEDDEDYGEYISHESNVRF